MEKYVNEETLIKDDIFKSLPEDLIICPICTLLMIEPVMCVNCMNHFCKKCTEDWNKKNNTCPNGCQNAILKTQIEKNRLITRLKFKCIKGCGAEIFFSDITNHYNSNCLEKKENEKNKSESKIRFLKKKEVAKLKNRAKLDYFTSKY